MGLCDQSGAQKRLRSTLGVPWESIGAQFGPIGGFIARCGAHVGSLGVFWGSLGPPLGLNLDPLVACLALLLPRFLSYAPNPIFEAV